MKSDHTPPIHPALLAAAKVQSHLSRCLILLILFAFSTTAPAQSLTEPYYSVSPFVTGIQGMRQAAIDSLGNTFVATSPYRDHSQAHVILKISPAGVVSIFAGQQGAPGSADGTGSAARFNGPADVAIDAADNLYVADSGNNTIRKITPDGVVTTLAGLANYPYSVNVDGQGSEARFSLPRGICVDAAGNIYVAEFFGRTIRKVTPSGFVTTVAGSFGSGIAGPGSADGYGSNARFVRPNAIAVDPAGNLYVADQVDHTIRKIAPDGVVTTLAGISGSPGYIDGVGANARFFFPGGVAVDNSGKVFVADLRNNVVRTIDSTGKVSTLGGSAIGWPAFFAGPDSVALHPNGNLYVSEPGALRIGVNSGLPDPDTEAPTITCPADMTLPTNVDPLAPPSPVTFSATAVDNFEGTIIEYSPPSGTIFPLGTTLVTCTARDPSGNTSVCTFNVSVVQRNYLDASGEGVVGSLTTGGDGRFYAPQASLHWQSAGSIFRVENDGTGFTSLHNFSYYEGFSPTGQLIKGSDGAFYGTTWAGGFNGMGTIFRISESGVLSVLHHFPYYDLGRPEAGLVQGSNGRLYGTTPALGVQYDEGGSPFVVYGAIFSINEDGSDFLILHQFAETEGAFSISGLIEGTDGAFYGTTSQGGVSNLGTVFKINADGSGFTSLHQFSGVDGTAPYAKLTVGADGALYGATFAGGTSDYGTLFKIQQDGSGFTVLHSFQGSDGSFPGLQLNYRVNVMPESLFRANDGSLYGKTSTGGGNGNGVVYQLNPNGSGFSVVHTFPANGGYPMSLASDEDGSIYGTTRYGGELRLVKLFSIPVVPHITSITPETVQSGSTDLALTIYGSGFVDGTTNLWNGQQLFASSRTETEIHLTIPASLLQSNSDVQTAIIQLKSPTGLLSNQKVFTILGNAANVEAVQTIIATEDAPVSVAIAPASDTDSGVAATLTHEGQAPATVTVAVYNSDPSPAGASFEVAGSFLDVNVNGATSSDSMIAYFSYPVGSTGLTLQYYNQASGNWENVVPALDDPANRRFEVHFDASSHPKITELTGTLFAAAVPEKFTFNGFLAPVSGADTTGGSFSTPLRTFKANRTVPVKFAISLNGAAVTTGVHRLQAIKYSNQTTAGTPIDAGATDAATAGNQFRLTAGEWHFNLDLKATAIDVGIWKLIATLSDGSSHFVWIQVK